MFHNSKKRTVAICSFVILAAAVSGYFYVHSLNIGSSSGDDQTKERKTYVSDDIATITKVGNQPTEDYKLPSGRYTKVMARQIVTKITNQDTVKSYGSSLTPIPDIPGIYVLKVPKGKSLDQAANEAEKKPGVMYAEVDKVTIGSVARSIPNDPAVEGGQQQFLLDISAPEGWAVNTNGVNIAIIDSGIQSDHPDLADHLLKNTRDIRGNGVDDDGNGYIDDYYGMDFVNGCDKSAGKGECATPTNDADGAEDDRFHGTSTAGLAAGIGDNKEGIAGVSWNSKILAVKVLDSKGAGSDLITARGVHYAVSRGIRVISFSGGAACDDNTDCISGIAKEYVDFAVAHNAVVVSSAGNVDNPGLDTAIYAPASYGPTIGVGGSITGTTPVELDPGSKYGDSGPHADLVAPYTQFTTKFGGGYTSFNGTSGSAPIVAGAVALMLGMKPGLTPAQVQAILVATADGPSSNKVGAGRLNLYKALKYTKECL